MLASEFYNNIIIFYPQYLALYPEFNCWSSIQLQ